MNDVCICAQVCLFFIIELNQVIDKFSKAETINEVERNKRSEKWRVQLIDNYDRFLGQTFEC